MVLWFHILPGGALRGLQVWQPDGTMAVLGVCLRQYPGYFSPSAAIPSLQTSTFQVSNSATGATMSLIKKADVEDYLSARRRKTVFPFAPIRQPNATGPSGSGPREAKVNDPKSRQVDGQERSSIRPSVAATESHVDPARSTYTSAVRKAQA
jgi:hypothetical protein